MLTKEVCRSIEQACQVAGALELNGVKLEEPTPAILDIREFDFDVHVAMQPAGTAYYNSLRREAARRLDALKKEFDIWRKKKMLAAKRALTAKRTASKPTKDDIEIQVQGDELTIKGKRKPMDEDDSVYHRRERGTGDFARFLTLPVEINASKVDATLNNGVLLLTLPKAASARPKQISVKAK